MTKSPEGLIYSGELQKSKKSQQRKNVSVRFIWTYKKNDFLGTVTSILTCNFFRNVHLNAHYRTPLKNASFFSETKEYAKMF